MMAAMLRPSRSPAELGIHRGAEVWMTILKIVVACRRHRGFESHTLWAPHLWTPHPLPL